ncbi:molybdopterin molybdotransferase MoeA [Altererythrobacter aquiaggeris]|uniref:molybdopterin molybdotransferase MoeA n=1 Tax=Aestuarierythrobacter aquiaggeris TaxID=1898396 RepID=UPI0030159CFC
MISVDEALAMLARRRPVMPSEVVGIHSALDRVLAADVRARVTLPPHPVSAMDGYAVRFADLAADGTGLTVIGEAPAGRPFRGQVGAGEAVRIFTGSHVPEGADHIVIQEQAERIGDAVRVTAPQERPANIRAAGLDFAEGDVLVKSGAKLGPAEIAAIAAADHGEVTVVRKLKITFIANGDELRAPGGDPAQGDIAASSYAGLSALVQRWGGEPSDGGIAADSVEAICERVTAARDADIIVPVGGASVGDHDHMYAAFSKLGLKEVFRKIAVRPGKPTWFGTMGTQLVLGLPGNPASAYVCAQLFLRTLIDTDAPLAWQFAKLSKPVSAEGPRETFVRGISRIDKDGCQHAAPLERQDSALITPFMMANCLIRRRAHSPAASAGAIAEILPLQC